MQTFLTWDFKKKAFIFEWQKSKPVGYTRTLYLQTGGNMKTAETFVCCLLLIFKVACRDHLTELLPFAWDFVVKGRGWTGAKWVKIAETCGGQWAFGENKIFQLSVKKAVCIDQVGFLCNRINVPFIRMVSSILAVTLAIRFLCKTIHVPFIRMISSILAVTLAIRFLCKTIHVPFIRMVSSILAVTLTITRQGLSMVIVICA